MHAAQEHPIETLDYFPTLCLSQYLKRVYQQAKKIYTKGISPVLITGEHGTGKEFLAKSIHYLNSSLQHPFFLINCINLPFEHFEKKLEQYLSVVSTPADGTSPEAKYQKKGGTIFIRDVGKLETQTQSKVFNLLKETCFKSARSSGSATFPTHLVFSYSQNGGKADESMAFKESLHRIFHQDTLSLIPLRERPEDIQPLASFFVDRYSKEYGKEIGGIHSEAIGILKSYSWPFNVSELKNVIENAVLLAQGPLITRDDIRFNISKKSITLESFFCREDYFTLEEIERIYLHTVLRRVKNNKSKAAIILGITRNTLQKRIESFAKPAAKKTAKKNSRQQKLPFAP